LARLDRPDLSGQQDHQDNKEFRAAQDLVVDLALVVDLDLVVVLDKPEVPGNKEFPGNKESLDRLSRDNLDNKEFLGNKEFPVQLVV
jgi:hypothetical protein